MPKKRKNDSGGGQEVRHKRPPVTCILHVSGIKHGEFTPFSQIKVPVTEKLAYLQNIRDKRLSQPPGSPNRMEAVCKSIPDNLTGADLGAIGYHRACYQHFTKNQDRLQCNLVVSSASHSPRKRPSSSGSLLFPAECIFCQKLEKKVSGKTERCTKFSVFKEKDGAFREPSWTPIASQSLAMGNGRLYRLVEGEDLFAREAQYHPSCHNAFKLQYVSHCRPIKAEAARCECDTEQQRKVAAHLKAFNIVLDFIQHRVVEQNEVVELSSLRLLYIQELESTDFPNPDYRSEKLKDRLQNHEIHSLITFAKVNPGNKGCISFNLVYNANLSVGDAVTYAYKLGSKDKYKDVALLLRGMIQQAFCESRPLPWPPTAEDLEVHSMNDVLPTDLVKFLNAVITGDTDMNRCEKTRRVVFSLGQVWHN